ncbi:MAG: SAM-dependent methyltransferase [Spirochaetales bacterium]|nr:SAM-dependent methyltransferase [Spirochaetales bacterium]
MSNEDIRYVTDSTRPNAGRIYDYWLGGDYNFPVDREVANKIEKEMPFVKSLARIIRWFLGNSIDRAIKMGFTQFLDFASGLPTVDHIHRRIPEGMKKEIKIVYSDIDPITVRIGNEIIGNNPLVKFVECDCRKPEVILKSDIANNFLNKNQKIAIGLSGVLYYLTDEQISYITKTLYEWAFDKSIIYFCDFDIETLKNDPSIQAVFDYYESINQPLYAHSKKNVIKLVEPWRVKEPGLQILEDWLNLPLDIAQQWGKFTGGSTYYGGFIEK